MSCERRHDFDPHGSPRERAALAAHLDVCDACREAWREERRLARRVRALDPEPASAALWDRIERALADDRARHRTVRRTRIRGLAALTAAALLAGAAWWLAPRHERASSLLGDSELVALAAEQAQLESQVDRLRRGLAEIAPAGDDAARSLRAQLTSVEANLTWCRSLACRNSANRALRVSLLDGYRREAALLNDLLSRARRS